MRNLFERLKPEHVRMLEIEEIEFPSTVKFLIKSLESNKFWSELTYSTIFILLNYLKLNDYSPSTIESIFNND